MTFDKLQVVGKYGGWIELHKHEFFSQKMSRKQAVTCISAMGSKMVMGERFENIFKTQDQPSKQHKTKMILEMCRGIKKKRRKTSLPQSFNSKMHKSITTSLDEHNKRRIRE